MLQENKNHVENTVDAIFKMEGGGFDVIQTDHSRRCDPCFPMRYFDASSDDYRATF